MEMSGEIHAPAVLTPVGRQLVGRFGEQKNLLSLTGLEPTEQFP